MTTSKSAAPGANWVRAALQVNPFGYKGHPAPSESYQDEAAYNTALLDECEALGITLLAITDHWKVSTAKGLIDDAAERGIVALPGFEANCREGFHLLVIFEAGTELESISTCIGVCGAPDDDPHGPGERTFAEIVDSMRTRGAVVIPAHVNIATSGLLSREEGKPLQKIVKHEGILALATCPGQPPMGDQLEILRNSKPYERAHSLIEIHADDVSHAAALTGDGATTWFKMALPSLQGLEHALRTPQTRVRTVQPPEQRGTRVTRISWTGGFLDGVSLPIGPELTALIGGRGTGKSTVIESLRFALDRAPAGEDARRDHDNVIRKVLGPGAVIRVEVETTNPIPQRFVIQRTVGDPPLVLDSSGSVTQQSPNDVVGDIEVFGQHELAELAGDKALLAQLVRRLGGDAVAEKTRPALAGTLRKNRLALGELEQQQETLETALADIPRLEEQMSRYDATDLEAKLAAARLIADERATLNEYRRRIELVDTRLTEFNSSTLLDEVRADILNTAEGDREIELDRARTSVEALATTIESAFATIRESLATTTSALQEATSAWSASVQPELDEHAATTRALVEEGYDPDGYLKTAAALKGLRLRAEERAVLAVRHSALLRERAEGLGRLAVLDAEIAAELTNAIKATNAVTKGKVVVRPVASPDRDAIKEVIGNHFRTSRTQIMAAIDKDEFSVRTFVDAVRRGAGHLAEFGVVGAQAAALVGHGEPLLRELEEHNVGLAVDVCLNVSEEGSDLRRLEDLSKGQRATALLLLLLGVANTPIVIDQPEDDLDNRFVYRGVVPRLRALKGERQILVSTHNANVPVLGDAELVVVLESDGKHGRTAAAGVGSLDERVIREYAEKLLEGGEDAFRARRHLYGF
ncbi:hypothetical protein K8O93_05530 [Gordonia bronchialis]|uniref:TrlF family AAA-like ATPase n=1 Tax=Gordonia bronchialis TaxID=2054 RepID=UPI001CBD436D|nr:hypothetical protein [Gordonia bronchialis]UAK39176.1 hypothetical protein K8O93_05530 [Gordonia bronchialis]